MAPSRPTFRIATSLAAGRAPLVATAWLLAAWLSLAASLSADEDVSFRRDVLPILSNTCFACHGPDAETREADLRLDTFEGATGVVSEHQAIAPGHPDDSELIRRITSDDPDERMPPADAVVQLKPGAVEILRRWIASGAKYEAHWAYEPPRRADAPTVKRADWVRNPVDAFILARLESAGLQPSPEAERATLIRRLTLDLTGLPPTPAEVDTFVADRDPRAYENLVDRLLSSPHYGERMAWDWLDAARYSDSNGYQDDKDRTMWPWRDWVVDAFNRNLPYDQFTIWQLAGDLLPEPTHEQRLATGFCRNHMINGEGGRIPEENRVDYVMDMTETTGTVWLAMTLTCCRCHDHKYDPVTRRDYYSLFAFFNQTPVNGEGGDPHTPPILAAGSADERGRLADFDRQIAGLAARLEQRRTELAGAAADADEDYRKIKEQKETLEKDRGALQGSLPKVMVMEDMAERRKSYLLERGLYNRTGDEVTAAIPASLPPIPAGAPANRLGLAQWLVAPDHPLTARVTVNRFWQQFFGLGLVKTTEDFGVQGEIPPQRELLDWLAVEFRESGWNVKALVRLFVTSATYRQSSRATEELLARDPTNRLYARGPRYRLPAWMLRDQALGASGLLSATSGGPPVNGYQPEGVWEEATFGVRKYKRDNGEALYRRSVYTFWRRIIAPTIFFDNASRQTCTVKAVRTNSPLHALLTLNDVTYVEAARVLAERALTEAGDADEARLDAIYRRVLARPARESERAVLLTGLNRSRAEFASDSAAAEKLLAVGESKRNGQIAAAEHAAWTSLALAVLNLDETLTKE